MGFLLMYSVDVPRDPCGRSMDRTDSWRASLTRGGHLLANCLGSRGGGDYLEPV